MSDLLVLAMEHEGIPREEARKKVYLVDSKGLVVKNRPSGGLNAEKLRYAHEREPINKLSDIIKAVKPSYLIGAAGQGPAFTREILENMAAINKRPVIFALSNPTSKAECTASEAYEATKGQCIFASGSPFPDYAYNGKTYIPGQGNNSYIFPGVSLAIVTCGIRHIPDEVFYIAAKTLSEQVTDENLASGLVYPPYEKIRLVSKKIGTAIAQYGYDQKLAAFYPKPENLEKFIGDNQYTGEYANTLPPRWSWGKEK
jgi:malate dehydrogenase (oxaloacetate-decarboxylating)(NADP+)